MKTHATAVGTLLKWLQDQDKRPISISIQTCVLGPYQLPSILKQLKACELGSRFTMQKMQRTRNSNREKEEIFLGLQRDGTVPESQCALHLPLAVELSSMRPNQEANGGDGFIVSKRLRFDPSILTHSPRVFKPRQGLPCFQSSQAV